MSRIGPSLPDPMVIGPALPPGFEPINQDEDTAPDLPDDPEHGSQVITEPNLVPDDPYGPSLPPAIESTTERVIGASLPPGLEIIEDESGPTLAIAASSADEEPDIGPTLPTGDEQSEYEQRLMLLKRQELIKVEKNKRESWMTELPQKLTSYGLGARTFSKSGVQSSTEDRSEWTDTPAEKAMKQKAGKSSTTDDFTKKRATDRDQNLEAVAGDMNKSRNETLVDMHIRKRKLESESGPGERKEFDRDTDLGISKMPKGLAGAKTLAEKAGQLGSRFSHGNEQKYL